MKNVATTLTALFFCAALLAQRKPSKPRYDTIIVKHVTVSKAAKKTAPKQEPALPVPEYINQPYYYNADANRLIKLENTTAALITKKKTLGLKGAKQILSMSEATSKIRFVSKNEVVFFIKTSGDEIDLTSYIKLYLFASGDNKREVTISSKEGLVNDAEAEKGKLIAISVKLISKDNYRIQFSQPLAAGEYGFVWLKNMELQEFNVFAFGIDWKSSD